MTNGAASHSRTVKSAQGDITSTFTYNAASLLTRIDLPSGGFLAYQYDAAHRLTAVSNEFGERIQYTLDNAGNPTNTEYLREGGSIAQVQDQVFDELSRLRTMGGWRPTTPPRSPMTTKAIQRPRQMRCRAPAPRRLMRWTRLKMPPMPHRAVTNFTYDDRGNLTSRD